MLRRLAKTGIAGALHWSGADRLIGLMDGARDMPLVIGYHRVVENFAESAAGAVPPTLVSRRMLERHLDWIGQRFDFISLDELGSKLGSGEKFSKPVAVVTFDDGYSDVYEHAFPLLKRKGIPAAVFVVTNLIGTSRLQTHDRLYLLFARLFSQKGAGPFDLPRLLLSLGIEPGAVAKKTDDLAHPLTAMYAVLSALPQDQVERIIEAIEAQGEIEESALKAHLSFTWEMLSEMQRAGMTIGSHTKSHALLTNETVERVADEAEGSRKELERRLGKEVRHIAYPDGRFNAATVRIVAASGYRYGHTTCRHRDPEYPLLTLPRTLLWENSCLDALGRFSPAIMSCHVHRVFQGGVNCGQDHDWPLYSRAA